MRGARVSWWGRLGLLVATLGAAAAGWFVTTSVLADDTDDEVATVVGEVPLRSCPTSAGAATVGAVAPGDRVWLIGVTGDEWAVIRHPQRPSEPAWMPMALVRTEARAGDLPEFRCSAAEVAVVTTTTAPTTTLPGVVATTTTVVGTTVPTTSTLPPTTVSGDIAAPVVTVEADRPYLYTSPAAGTCAIEAELLITVRVADPTLPVSVRSIVAEWMGPGGPQSANLTPIAGRFKLVVTAGGPLEGELPLTIIATGVDGAGNVGVGSLVVSLRNPASFECAP